jgi:hypothetical protein
MGPEGSDPSRYQDRRTYPMAPVTLVPADEDVVRAN